jgi:hypothetical protein
MTIHQQKDLGTRRGAAVQFHKLCSNGKSYLLDSVAITTDYMHAKVL